jgi:ribosomal protein S18 acetylase RimI-like enzyme
MLAYVLVRYFTEGSDVPGFAFLASLVSVLAGAQLFTIGVIGEYLARVHVRVMDRPSYTVREQVGAPLAAGAEVGGLGGVEGDPGDPAELLPWDSGFFGFSIGRVRGESLDHQRATKVDEWAARNGVACLYLLAGAEDAATARVAADHGYRQVDQRLTLVRRAETGPAAAGAGRRGGIAEVREARESDTDALLAIARDAHTDTRFFFDGGFPRERCREMYATWLDRDLTDPDTTVLVAVAAGEPAGYITIGGDEPRIGLVAVAEGHRGEGLGAALVDAALAAAPSGADVRVVTQGRNAGALRMYESRGFVTETAASWFHKWFE